jgi:hypothetical protein
MTNNFQELHLLLSQASQEYRHGLREIIGAPRGDSPALLCDHLRLLRTGAAGRPLEGSDYKQLVTDIADKVGIDWSSLTGLTPWAVLSAEQIEAAIVRHVDGDKIYIEETQPQLPDAMGALDDAFSSLSSDWRKLLAAVIYVHQVIRPSAQVAARADEPEIDSEPKDPDSPGSGEPEAALLEGDPALHPTRKTGDEPLRSQSHNLGPTLLDFWRWSASDLVSNDTRGVIAEFIVSRALGLDDGVRTEWDAFDLLFHGLKIEVKSASYLQSWFHRQPSVIRFAIRSTRLWDSSTNVTGVDLKRRADLYVFCLLTHMDKETLDPLDVAQWEFYVVPSSALDSKFPLGKSIALAGLQTLGIAPITYEELGDSIQRYAPPAALEQIK